MYGSQYRYAVEVADQETGIYVATMITNDATDVIQLSKDLTLTEFRVVIFKQDNTSIYLRSDFVKFDLTGMTVHQRYAEFSKLLDVLANM